MIPVAAFSGYQAPLMKSTSYIGWRRFVDLHGRGVGGVCAFTSWVAPIKDRKGRNKVMPARICLGDTAK